MRDPTISVIMGTYNPDFKKLEIAIESIKSQSFKDWEYIICDDGSSNNAYEWLIDHYGCDDRFHILKNNKNMKLAATLNKCIDCSRGKYIARMDDDDYSYSDRFEKEINVLQDDQMVSFVSSSIDLYDGKKIFGKYEAILKPTKKNFLWGSPFVHPATMFRKNALLQVCGYRSVWITTRTEDFDLFMRLYTVGLKGINISEPLLRYYVNPIAMKKRKYIYSFQESITRLYGYNELKILFPFGILCAIKPLIVGLIPKRALFYIQSHCKF